MPVATMPSAGSLISAGQAPGSRRQNALTKAARKPVSADFIQRIKHLFGRGSTNCFSTLVNRTCWDNRHESKKDWQRFGFSTKCIEQVDADRVPGCPSGTDPSPPRRRTERIVRRVLCRVRTFQLHSAASAASHTVHSRGASQITTGPGIAATKQDRRLRDCYRL